MLQLAMAISMIVKLCYLSNNRKLANHSSIKTLLLASIFFFTPQVAVKKAERKEKRIQNMKRYSSSPFVCDWLKSLSSRLDSESFWSFESKVL